MSCAIIFPSAHILLALGHDATTVLLLPEDFVSKIWPRYKLHLLFLFFSTFSINLLLLLHLFLAPLPPPFFIPPLTCSPQCLLLPPPPLPPLIPLRHLLFLLFHLLLLCFSSPLSSQSPSSSLSPPSPPFPGNIPHKFPGSIR